VLDIANLVAGYNPEAPILQGVNLQIQQGELVVVIGANGAGKSTLAKVIFGLVPWRTGKLEFQGRSLLNLSTEQIVRQKISYVPQSANVFPALTIGENLEMGAYLADPKHLRQQMTKIWDIFPILAKKPHQRAGTLSGGERQMLAMGRALMLEPELLILDEPSAALSPILVTEIFQLICDINRQGTTIMLVEQNARKALSIAHRGFVMDTGKVEFTGTGQELLHDPRIGELYLGVSRVDSSKMMKDKPDI
jgi:neutral amino acid transport system ATP-binding protein